MISDREPFSGQFSLEDVQNLEDTQGEKKQPQEKAAPKQAADKIQKNGVTLTGEPADRVVIDPVYESKESTAVMTFGRFNPPTVGHEKLIHSVENVAKEHGGKAHIVASHSEGTAKDPLPQKAKLGYLSKVAHKDTTVMGSSKEEPTIMHAAAKLHSQGHQHLVVVAGSDRVDEYHKLLNKYNNVAGKHGHYNFKSIKVVSAGHRDPDAEGVEGMSGTKMRSLAREGKHKEFKAGLPKALHPHAKEMIGHISAIKEEVELEEAASLQLRLHRASIMRRNAKKIARAREIARQRLAKAIQMRRRALKRARNLVRARVAGAQGAKYNELSTSDKIAVDRMTDKRKKQIIRIANRLAPRVKRDEVQRLAAVAAGKQVRNSKTPLIASYEMNMDKPTLTEKAASALIRKAEKSNVSLAQIAEAYAAGMASYPQDSKQTLQQWAFASVNTFLASVNEVSDELAMKVGKARTANVNKAGDEYRKTAFQPDHVRNAALNKLKDAEAKRNKGNKVHVARSDRKFKDFLKQHTAKLAARSPEQVKKDNEAENAERHKNYKERGWTLESVMESKMAELHADIGSAIDKHVASYKAVGGAEHLMSRIDKAATKIAKTHKLKPEHAKKFVSDYVQGKLSEQERMCPVCGQTPCNCTHITERKDVVYTARNMTDVDFDKLPKVHTFAQHQKLKAEVEKDTDDKASRKKAELIRRASGEVQRKVVEAREPSSVYARVANRITRVKSPQLDNLRKDIVNSLKQKEFDTVANIMVYLVKDKLAKQSRIVQEDVCIPEEDYIYQEWTMEEWLSIEDTISEEFMDGINEEDNEGRKLNKPFRTPGGPKKFAVYVKNDKGNVIKLGFGDPNLEIKRDDPDRRKAYRARHGCDNPGPKWKANYWSCNWSWSASKKVGA